MSKLGIPAMERHSSLYDSLNDSCKKSNLTSWTKHVNTRGTVYTIRFDENSAILDPKDPENVDKVKNTIYRPKSRYHVNRDFLRMRELNNSYSSAQTVKNSTLCDMSDPSEIHPSIPVPIVNNLRPTQINSDSSNTQASVLRSAAHSHSMSDAYRYVSPDVTEIHDSPLVQYECIDEILPLVQFEATQYDSLPSQKCEHAVCIPEPVKQLPANIVSLPALSEEYNDPPFKPFFDISQADSYPSPISYDISFESQAPLERGVDFLPIDGHDHSSYSPPFGYVEKELSSKDILCKSCSGTAPAGTDMLYCDSCFIHLCGNCMISNSFAHSQSCNNKLRYMSEHEMHLQYVPGSNNSSTISDCSRPPDKSLRDTKTDQQVPDD